MDPISITFLPLIVALVVGAAIASIVKQNINKNVKLLGDQLGLDISQADNDMFSNLFRTRYPELTGKIDEKYNIRIYMFARGGGKSRRVYTAFDINCNNSKRHTLSLMSEGFFRKIGKALGMQADIEVRDEEFDGKFIVKSDNPLFVKQIFADPDMREVFIRNANLLYQGSFVLQGDNLHYEAIKSINSPTSARQIESLVALATLLIRRLEEMGDEQIPEYKEW